MATDKGDIGLVTQQPGGQSFGVTNEAELKFVETPLISQFCFALCCPCATLQSCVVLNEGEQMVVMNTGHLVAEITEPGCHFYNICNRELRTISKKKQVLTLERCKLAEKTGNPMMISAVIVSHVVVPSKALMKVTSLTNFVHTQAQAVLRNIVAQYPFESHDGSPCLLHDSAIVNRALATALNHSIQEMGVICTSFSLDEISFAPEIASTMLQRQAAQALVDARKVIVHGAAELASSAVQALSERGINLTDQQRGKLLSNLLPVLCATERENSSE